MTTQRYDLYQVGEHGVVGPNQHVLLLKEGERDKAFAHCPSERLYGFLSPDQTVQVREMMSKERPTTIVGGEESGLAEAILNLPSALESSPALTTLTMVLLTRI